MSPTDIAPRISLFEGASIKVFQEEDFIGFRAVKGHQLTSPRTATTVYLRDSAIFSVAVVPQQPPDWVCLQIHGDFREGHLPDDMAFAPIAADDGAAISALLTERLRLPRRYKAIYPYILTLTGARQLEGGTYIRVVGRYDRSGHREGPNFEGVQLTGDMATLQGLISGKRYAVTGYYGAGLQGDAPRPVGWSGRTIWVRKIQREPEGTLRSSIEHYEPPPSPFRRGPVWAWLQPAEEHGYKHFEFSTRLDPTTRIVAALEGQGGDGDGHRAARLGLLTLATLIPEPAYQPFLDAPTEPPSNPRDDFAAWVAWLVDRRPLPTEPVELLNALGDRIGEVLEEINLRGYSLGLGGVLATIQDGRVTLLRRGLARVYLLRKGQLQLLLYEDTLGRLAGSADTPEMRAHLEAHFYVPVSLFVPSHASGRAPPLEIEVQPGDRLLFAVGRELVEALADPQRERLLAATVPGVAADMPPTPAMQLGGWGVVAVDIDRPATGAP